MQTIAVGFMHNRRFSRFRHCGEGSELRAKEKTLALVRRGRPWTRMAQGVHLQMRVVLGDILLQRSNDSYDGELSVALVKYDPDGRMSRSALALFKLRLTSDQREQAMKTGFEFGGDWKIEDNIRKARLIIFDRASKLTGSITIPIHAGDRGSLR